MKTWFNRDSKFRVCFLSAGKATKGLIHIEDENGELRQWALIYFPSKIDCVNRTVEVIYEFLDINNMEEGAVGYELIKRAEKRKDKGNLSRR